MEKRKSTTAGVVFWTPAPVHTSPTSSVVSEWEDEYKEQAEKDDDFVSQMDENGIIGLSEALEDVELEETCNPNQHSGSFTPEEAEPSGHEGDTPAEELSPNLREHLSPSESPGQDELSPCGYLISSLKAQTVDEEVRQQEEEQATESHPERDKYLGSSEEETNGETETSGELGVIRGSAGRYTSKGEIEKICPIQPCSAHLLAMDSTEDSRHHCPQSQPASLSALTPPHLLHFTAEEIAAPGIEAETLPELSYAESLPESYRSQTSATSSPRSPEIKLRTSLQPEAMFSEDVMSNHNSGVNNEILRGWAQSDTHRTHPTPSPRKTRQHSPEATYLRSHSLRTVKTHLKFKHQAPAPHRDLRTPRATSNTAEVDESRKGPLSYRTPDFSKVEPRVCFPKSGYKPPKSRRPTNRQSLSPELPLVFKSPADIVKEVLLNPSDGSPGPSASHTTPATNAPNSAVPEEFRCRYQATILFDQLQEDYNRLLTKYAEAENTIDRLRLEAKVNLYSDPPKPGHSVQSGLNQQPSKFMTLVFPQAQRAEINSSSLHPKEHSPRQRGSSACPSTIDTNTQVGQQLANILYGQVDKFLQQLQTFEDILKRGKLKPVEQTKALSQLAEGLDSLERGYLLAKDEHKLLQHRGAENSHFDPERELEGLIFQCGLRLDELKEQVEQLQQEQPTCDAPPSPPPLHTSSSVRSEGGDTQPQSPPEPLLNDPGEAAAVEVSSPSEESDEEEAESEDEETLTPLYLRPLNGKHRSVEEDFANLIDHYQSFKELPKLLDHSQREGASVSAGLRTDMQPGDKEKERQNEGSGNMEVQRSPAQSQQQTSSSSRRASSQSTTSPSHHPSSSQRLGTGKSHSSSLSSLGEVTAVDGRNTKLRTGRSRVLPQDGIISPETDSGFVGSESSRLTPAAATSPLHQRASESVSVPQAGSPGKSQTGPVSAASPFPSPSHSHTAVEPGRGLELGPDQPRRSRQGQRRRTFSCSPKRWVSQTDQSSECGPESDSTNGQNDHFTGSMNSLQSSSSSSSPAEQRHHGDPLRALSSSQVANHSDAVRKLQVEVTRLREKVESCLRSRKLLSSVRAAPSAQENYTRNTSTPRVRSEQQWSDASRGRRDRKAVDEVEDSALRRTARKRPPSIQRQKGQPDILTLSEPSTPQLQSLVSRCTQTPAAQPDSCCSHTDAVHSRARHRQRPGVSAQACETADEPDSRSQQAPLCPQCLSGHRGQFKGKGGGKREPAPCSAPCYRCCPLCGCLQLYSSTEPDCRRVSDSPPHTRCQPAQSPDRAARSRYLKAAAPPIQLQYMPVCPPPLLVHASPLYVSSSSNTGTSSGVRGHMGGRRRRSMSADRQQSMDSSLNKAIRAARHMKHTSGHMARSLATGLQYQELLLQSCSY